MENNMIDKLKAMLDDPSAMAALSAIMGSVTSDRTSQKDNITPSAEEKSDPPTNDITDISSDNNISGINQADMIMKIQKMMSQVKSDSDPRINLLNSLKPYMRSSRSVRMDQAIKLIQISKIASVFRQNK